LLHKKHVLNKTMVYLYTIYRRRFRRQPNSLSCSSHATACLLEYYTFTRAVKRKCVLQFSLIHSLRQRLYLLMKNTHGTPQHAINH